MIRTGESRPEEAVDAGHAIVIRPRPSVRLLGFGAAAIVLLHLIVQVFVEPGTVGDSVWFKFSALDGENTVPTWYGSLLLLIASACSWTIYRLAARAGGRWKRHWLGLAVMLLAFSLDEVAGIHETLSFPIREALDLEGTWFFAWVIPALVAVAVVGIVYLRFVLQLPSETRSRVIVGGILFVAGAIGMEMLGGNFVDDRQSLGYIASTTVEEVLEMAGVLLVTSGLLRYLGSIRLAAEGGPGAREAAKRRPS